MKTRQTKTRQTKFLKQKLTLKKKVKDLTHNNEMSKEMNGGTNNIKQFIKILNKLSTIMKNKGEQFRANAYIKAINELNKYLALNNKEINSSKELKALNLTGIGKTILQKYDEFLATGTLEALEKEKDNPINIFTNIYGIGPKTANELVNSKNIKTLDELIQRQNEKQENKLPLLNDKQKIGLKYYHELLKRIPRQEIEKFKILLQTNFNETITENNDTLENHKFEIVGSYRRNKPDSGDIDLIFTSTNDKKIILEKFIEKLQAKNILLEILSNGELKSLTIGKLLVHDAIPRRIDFLYSPPEEYVFAILYFTGSKEFNTAMRQHALNVGLTLNEHGFHKMTKSTKEEKINPQLFKTEKDIFDFLNMEYKEPQDRIDENSVILTSSLEEIKNKIQKPEIKEEIKAEIKEEINLAIQEEIKESTDCKRNCTENKKNSTKNKHNCTENKKNSTDCKQNCKTLKKYTKKIKDEIIENLNKLKSQGITSLASLSIEELTLMLKEALTNYYISDSKENTLLTDNEYDILREYILKKDPTNVTAKEQHTQIKLDKSKVKLPYEMWSMDKIKPDTNAIDKFKKKYKGPYVISAKLDGVSALYSTETDTPSLYTRGDGKYGQLISHIIPYLNLPTQKNITLRGELIIKEDTFKTKYKGEFSNSRNFISGLVNRKKISATDAEIFKDIDFVGYEVIVPENLTPSQQYNKLVELKTISVKNIQNIKLLTNDLLSNTLIDFRTNYEYTIDGIICIDDNIYLRESSNPDHAFAFKMVLTDQEIEAKVLDVLWTASKDGLLKPRVQFEPVTIGGVTITYATGFNAKFIKDNNIGLGALVRLIRSGDVIPYIKEVITPAEQPIMPNIEDEYIWTESNVDIKLVNTKTDSGVLIKSITKFFKDLEVDGLGEGNIKKIINSGANSIQKIINLTPQNLILVEGFKEKMANKICNSIQQRLQESSIAKIATASNIFGRGFAEKSIIKILEAEPTIFTSELTTQEKINKVKKIEGFGQKTASQFVKAIPEFNEFISLIKYNKKELKEEPEAEYNENSKEPKDEPKDEILKNKTIVLSDFNKSSKFTKKELTNELIKLGAKIESTITKSTNMLIVGSLTNETTKMKKAKDYKTIEIIELDDFIKQYLT